MDQAEQQSQLEDLARKYEADGKITIAKTLRERALLLTSTNLAGEGMDVIEAVTAEPLRLIGPNASSAGRHLENLPDFSAPPKPEKKSRRRGNNSTSAGPQVPEAPGAES